MRLGFERDTSPIIERRKLLCHPYLKKTYRPGRKQQKFRRK